MITYQNLQDLLLSSEHDYSLSTLSKKDFAQVDIFYDGIIIASGKAKLRDWEGEVPAEVLIDLASQECAVKFIDQGILKAHTKGVAE